MEPQEFISLIGKSTHLVELFSNQEAQKKIIEPLKNKDFVIALQKQESFFLNKLIPGLAVLAVNDIKVILSNFLDTYYLNEDMPRFLASLDADAITFICKYTSIKKYIPCAHSFSKIMEVLLAPQRALLFTAMFRYLPTFVKDALSLSKILKFCTSLQRENVYDATLLHLEKTIATELKIEKISSSGIASTSSYSLMSHFFMPLWGGSTTVFDAQPCEEEIIKKELNIERIWSPMIKNAMDFYTLLLYLPLRHRQNIYLTLKNRLLSLIKNAQDVYLIMANLSPEQKTDFYNLAFNETKKEDEFSEDFEIIKIPIDQFINNENDFKNIFTQLSVEQCFLVGKKIQHKIQSIFKETHCFIDMSQKLSLEQFQALCESVSESLCHLIYELSDFQQLSRLPFDKQKVFFKSVQPHLVDFLKGKMFCFNDSYDPFTYSLNNLYQELKLYFKKICGETCEEREAISLQFFYKDKEPIEIKSSSQLIQRLSLREWFDVLEKTKLEYEKKIMEAGSGIQYFVRFYENLKKHLSLEETAHHFFDFYYDLIETNWVKFIKNSADFNSVFSALNLEEKEKFFTLIQSIIPGYIHNFEDIKLILMQLSRAQKIKIYEQIKQDLWIKPYNLEEVLSYFNQVLPDDFERIQKDCLINLFKQLEKEDKKTPKLDLFISEKKEQLLTSSCQEMLLFFRESFELVRKDLFLEEPSSLDSLFKKIAIVLKKPNEHSIYPMSDTLKVLPKEPLIFKKTFFEELEYLKKQNTSEAFAADKLKGFDFFKSLLRSFLNEERMDRGLIKIKIMDEEIHRESEQVLIFEEGASSIEFSLVEPQGISFFPTAAYKTYLSKERLADFSEEEFYHIIELTHRQDIVRQTLISYLGMSKQRAKKRLTEENSCQLSFR